jgi:hypothetical protein
MKQNGRITPTTLCWQEGMDEWQEHRVVFGEASQEKSPTRAIPPTPAQSASIELDYSSERRTVSRTARDYFIKFGVIGLITLVGIYAVTHYITAQKTKKAQQDRIAINPAFKYSDNG